MTSRSKLQLLIAGVAASQLGSTDCGQITTDPGCDLWCGEQLCSWKIDHGDVRQVATWHEGDDGVDLASDDVAIYQLTPVTNSDAQCIEFTMLADIELGPDVRFQVDIWGDGSYELDEAIPEARWRPLSYRFAIDGRYNGVKFQISKRGAGHAVVAQLDAHVCDEGVSAGRVLSPGAPPNGSYCYEGGMCASGVCDTREEFPGAFDGRNTCSTCDSTLDCTTAGDVCGVAFPPQYTLAAYGTCVPMASKVLGQACGIHEECASGTCSVGVCSSCFATSCGSGISCERSVVLTTADPLVTYPAPLVCAPSSGQSQSGVACSENDDCASGTCNGAPRRICIDGRACNNDTDCPIAEGLDHGSCATVGVLGGTCQ